MCQYQTQKTLTLRDPANSWSQDWQVNLTSNGYPGYRVIVDPDTDKILVGDPSHDENATNDGLIRVFNDDGTVNQTVVNPTSPNTFFGIGFDVKNGKLVSKVRVGSLQYGSVNWELKLIKELELDKSKVNIYGSGISLGHPIGVSGTRIVMSLMTALERENKRFGMASICIGGGEALSMIVEKIK